jgi:hypothetical protein
VAKQYVNHDWLALDPKRAYPTDFECKRCGVHKLREDFEATFWEVYITPGSVPCRLLNEPNCCERG